MPRHALLRQALEEGFFETFVFTDGMKAAEKKLGGKVVLPVTKLPDVTLAQFSDPEGNVIGLIQG